MNPVPLPSKISRSGLYLWFWAAAWVVSLCFVEVAQGQWPATDPSARPWAYNWWLGSAVDKGNLSRELQRYHDAGIGGIHVIPIYGVKGAENRSIRYLSPEWLEMMGFALQEARKLGMDVDLTLGTGWCYGGPSITQDLGGWKVVVKKIPAPEDGKLPASIDLRKIKLEAAQGVGPDGKRQAVSLNSNGQLAWTPPTPGWNLFVLGREPAEVKVKRAAPGGEGRMLNPFNPQAMRKYLEPFTSAFAHPETPKPRAMYHDSYEYYGVNWTPGFLEAFQKRRGYRLQEELEAFAGEGDPERIARVRCDYRETLSDLLIKETFSIWADWCRQLGMLSRNQAHGAPANLLDFYALADMPETEMFGHGGPDSRVSRFDDAIGKADREPLVSKFASSAAHVAGKPRVCSETGTWLAEHFCESFEELKGLVDLLFLSGGNHVFYHGCAYSPDDAVWPGWLFYAATEMNPRNPLWREAPALNQYIERSQAVLREGNSDNDLLLYWPIHDLWSKTKQFGLSVHNRDWLTRESLGRVARALWEKGYGFDYVSDTLFQPLSVEKSAITGPCHSQWRAVLVPECRQMPLETLQKLFSLARDGGTVLFEKEVPSTPPGLANLEARRDQMNQILSQLSFRVLPGGTQEAVVGKGRVLVGGLEELLKSAGIGRERLVDQQGLKFIRRKNGADRTYFLVNHHTTALDAWIPLGTVCNAVSAMDPMTGKFGYIPIRKAAVGETEVAVRIEPGHSLFLKTQPGMSAPDPCQVFSRPGEELKTIGGTWQIRFLCGGPELPNPYRAENLKSWTENGDPATEAFSGSALYRVNFDFSDPSNQQMLLDLGEVRHVCRVTLNGKGLGSLIMHPYRVRIPAGTLKASGNQLEVEVSNLGANRLRDLDRRGVQWKIFNDINFASISYKPFDASNWPVMQSGLLGPVRIVKVSPE